MSDLEQKPEQAKAEIINAEIVPVIDSGVVLMPVMNIQAAKQRLAEFQEFVKGYLVPDEDYGTIPGTAKPTLFKPGADKLCELYGLADDFAIESKVENYGAEPPLFDYTFKCILTARRDGRLVGTGVGSCNSWEGKYRFRESKRKCPLCGKEAIIAGKAEYGGGWLCWKKREGCGAKFVEDDKAITDQKAGKEVNDDVCTLKNTILKMAKKRAKIDAVIAVTRSSGIFTQDMDDIIDHDNTNGSGTRQAAERVKDEKIAELKKKTSQAVAKTLFWATPDKFNGHRAIFLNLKEFGAGLNEVAAEGLRALLKQYMHGSDDGGELWVPTSGMFSIDKLLAELEGCGVPTKKLQAKE
jgi:hypothetical protein